MYLISLVHHMMIFIIAFLSAESLSTTQIICNPKKPVISLLKDTITLVTSDASEHNISLKLLPDNC